MMRRDPDGATSRTGAAPLAVTVLDPTRDWRAGPAWSGPVLPPWQDIRHSRRASPAAAHELTRNRSV